MPIAIKLAGSKLAALFKLGGLVQTNLFIMFILHVGGLFKMGGFKLSS